MKFQYYRKRELITLLIVFLIATPFFASCGSGGGSGSSDSDDTSTPKNGMLLWDPSEVETGKVEVDETTGTTIYTGTEGEIAQGVFLKQSLILMPDDPNSEIPSYKAGSILRFRNTTGEPLTGKFLVNSVSSLSENINELRFKFISEDGESDPIDVFINSQGFVQIDEFIDAGYAEIIYQNGGSSTSQRAFLSSTALIILALGALGIAAARGAWEIAAETDKSSIVDVPPVSLPSQIILKSKDEKLAWINKWLNQYCEALKKSAKTNNIPPRLVAAVILNELADFDAWDQTQMLIRERDEGSYGWVQLQISRVLEKHKLIDIGDDTEVRDPEVDITNTEIADSNFPRDMAIKNILWSRLINPNTAIEIAAREISYILDKLEKGDSTLENAWAKALLKNPSEGIDRDDIYANLKTENISGDQIEHQKNLEESLAILVIAPYNTPNILNEKEPDKIQLETATPWQEPPRDDVDFYNARQHSYNVKTTSISKMVYELICLKDAVLEVPKLKNFFMNETITKKWDGTVFEIETESISGPSKDILGYRPTPGTVIFDITGDTVCEEIVSYSHKIEHKEDSTYREFIGRPNCEDNSDLYISLVDYNSPNPSITLLFDFYGNYKWSDDKIWPNVFTTYNPIHSSKDQNVEVKNNVYSVKYEPESESNYGDNVVGTINITVEFPD